MSEREQRLAENEARFRLANERLEAQARRSGDVEDGVAFLCECADPDCTEELELSLAQYERLRTEPTRFAVRPGHVAGIEVVVERNAGHWVVEKTGEAAAVAEASDPRG